MKELLLNQTIEKIQYFINTGQGDTGRLSHILESLRNKKRLYDSDRLYLENKLNAGFSLRNNSENKGDVSLLAKIRSMLDSGIGDPGRLQYIYDFLDQNKTLYRSDQVYLEKKIAEQTSGKLINNSDDLLQNYSASLDEQLKEKTNQIRQLKEEIKTNEQLRLDSANLKEIMRLRGAMPKNWDTSQSSEVLTGIYEKIKLEQEKLDEQKLFSNEINLQSSKLSQLILNRQEYERQIALEKIKLDSQIKEERERIEIQTKIAEQITLQKKELEHVTLEKNLILQEISKTREQTEKELEQTEKKLEQQKKALFEVQSEQVKIESQIKKEQDQISKTREEQKIKLNKQLEIAKQIKEKQIDLETSKQKYDKIVEQTKQEKSKLRESKKFKKSIDIHEKTLLKTKNKRLHLISLIEQQKELLSKKTKEEEEKLKEQGELVRQLTEEKLDYERLRQRRKTLEQQIKEIEKKLNEKYGAENT